MRAIGKSFVQAFGSGLFFVQFIAHELLYLYITSKSTISKLRIFDRQFQSHPGRPATLTQKPFYCSILDECAMAFTTPRSR